MFESTKRKIEAIVFREITGHSDYHNLYYHEKMQKYVCETCGCFIAPQFAVAGEKEIRKREGHSRWNSWEEDCIYTPYYCKGCAPKVKK